MIDYAEDSTVYVWINTIDANGEPTAPSSALTVSDIAIYKDDSDTPKATTNGLTMTSPVNSQVGLHRLAIDTSVDTGDAGWWEAGSVYQVVLNTVKTVDGRSIDAVIVQQGQFGIEATGRAATSELTKAVDRLGYCLATLAGATTDGRTETAAYTITIDGVAYTVTYAGLTSAGVRTAPTLAKA